MKKMLAVSTFVFSALAALAAAKLPYSSQKFVMGSGAATGAATVLNGTAKLAFPNVALDYVAGLLDEGYVFGACQCGTSCPRYPMQAKSVRVCRDPGSGEIGMIVVVFVVVDDGWTKSIAVELTNGTGGVYARGASAQYVGGSQPDFAFAEQDGNGGVSYAVDNGRANRGSVAGFEGGGYGACGLTIAKAVPADAPLLIWANAAGEPALTVDDVKDCDFLASFCGTSIAREYLGRVVKGYNKKVETDESGAATSIRVEFQMVEGDHLKCALVELTTGEGGVYAKQLASFYKDDVQLGHKFVQDDGSYDITGDSAPGFYGCHGTTNGYGVFALCAFPSGQADVYREPNLLGTSHYVADVTQLPILTSTWVRLLKDGTIEDLFARYELSAYMAGASVGTKQAVTARGISTYTPPDETAATKAVCSFVFYDGGHTKSASVELEARSDGVWARYGKGQYLNQKNDMNFNFAYFDDDGNFVYACNVSGSGAAVYGGVPLTWDHGGYAIAGLKATRFMRTDESCLVWSAPDGLPALTLDDVKDHYLGCYFNGAWIGSKNGDGIGLNRTFQYDEAGKVKQMRVEFQLSDDNFAKCVVMEFTNGVAGVYGQAVAARYVSATSVGYHFVNSDGSLAGNGGTVATSAGVNGYGIYELYAAPMMKLEQDLDVSGRGTALYLGPMVLDLNGHAVTADGVQGDNSLYAKIINTALGETATVRCRTPEGSYFENRSVRFGRSSTSTRNIKFVKEGAGAYGAFLSQEYTGGNEITAGTVRFGVNGSWLPLGPASQPFTIGEGVVFDMNGQYDFPQHSFILAGGEIRNTGSGTANYQAQLKNVSLTADSSFAFFGSYGFIGNGYSDATLDLAGNTLTVRADGVFYLFNTTITAGRLEVAGSGSIVTGRDVALKGVSAAGVDLVVDCALNMYSPMAVHDYVARYSGSENSGTAEFTVGGTFKPSAHNLFYGCTLQNGATLDLSGRTTALPIASEFETGDNTLKFADGATIGVKLGEARSPLVSWTTAPENIGTVKFKCVDEGSNCSIIVKSDGLYAVTGLTLFLR